METPVLNSWKEIAAYLGRGRRTVQRWERELQLPVRRPHGRSRSAVIALRSEVDAWLAKSPSRNGQDGGNGHSDRDANRQRLQTSTGQLLRRAATLRRNAEDLRDKTLLLMNNLQQRKTASDLRREKIVLTGHDVFSGTPSGSR